jgi:hypothetical protein
MLRILSLSDLKPLEIDSTWIVFGLRLGKFSFGSPLPTPGGRRVRLGGGGGGLGHGVGAASWARHRAGTAAGHAAARRSGARQRAPRGNGHWANSDGLKQAETRSRSAVGFAQGRRGREIAGPAEVLAQKHSKALQNSKTFIVSKYI